MGGNTVDLVTALFDLENEYLDFRTVFASILDYQTTGDHADTEWQWLLPQ